jgi:hypothetical protein
LRRVTFVGSDGKLSNSVPLTIFPDGTALPSPDDFYLKAIGGLVPVDARGGEMASATTTEKAKSVDVVRSPDDRVHSQLVNDLTPRASDGSNGLRGADLLTSWISELDTSVLK